MEVHKFGGSLLRNIADYKKVISYISTLNSRDIICVVSASYNSTNLLTNYCLEKNKTYIEKFFKFHNEICKELNITSEKLEWLKENFRFIEQKFIEKNLFIDQLISYGELISTEILSLATEDCEWVDIREFIKTNNDYGKAKLDLDKTKEAFKKLSIKKRVITQGFIGESEEGYTSTLGREGSDYSASVIAYLKNAKKLYLHKDVGGLHSIDPKIKKTKNVLEKVSYTEAHNMGLFGPQVIHHKTIKPLIAKGIRTQICHLNEKKGTLISNIPNSESMPIIALKPNQVLIEIELHDKSNLGDLISFFQDNAVVLENLKYDHTNVRFLIDNSIGGKTLASGDKDILIELSLEDKLKSYGNIIKIKVMNQITFIKENIAKNYKCVEKYMKRLNEIPFEVLETPNDSALCIYLSDINYKNLIKEI